jgi:hypothetical protein
LKRLCFALQTSLRYSDFAPQSELEASRPMHVSEAEQTLREVERVRRDTRRSLHPLWFANVVTAVFFLGATLVGALADSSTLPIAYWVIGVPAGLAVIVRHDVRNESRLGAQAKLADPASGILLALIAGVVVAHQLTDGSFGQVAWIYPVAAGWLGLAALFRDGPLCAAAVALLAVGTAIVAIEPAEPWIWANVTMALLLLAAGLVARAWERA